MNRYLNIPYVAGGRDTSGLDCLGLIRLVRHEIFGRELMPECATVDPDNKRQVTKTHDALVASERLHECQPQAGTIAAAFKSVLCIHVGVVIEADGRKWIMETNAHTGVCLTPIRAFENQYTKVIYYDN